MVVLKREMNITDSYKSQQCYNLNFECQASINSDGNITLRNYDVENKSMDEIIVMSKKETEAIFKLMHVIKEKIDENDLPF